MDLPIDWGTVNWLYFAMLVAIVFVVSLIGSVLSFHRHIVAALISAILFGALFIFWTYYPHHLPLPASPIRTVAAPPPPAPATPAAPVRPANPIRDIAPR